MNNNRNKNKLGLSFFLLILGVSLCSVMFASRLFYDKRADVSFAYQLEHLVNLDLLKSENNRKISLNDNLVTFSGDFRDSLTEESKNRYRFINLLNQNHILSEQIADLSRKIDISSGDVYNSAEYFIRLTGIELQEDFVVSESSDTDKAPVVIPVSVSQNLLPTNLKGVIATFRNALHMDIPINLDNFGKSIDFLVTGFSSHRLGIGDESMKNQLKKARSLMDSDQSDKVNMYGKVLYILGNITDKLKNQTDGTRLYGLRSVRNYVEYSDKYVDATTKINLNRSQMERLSTKVANVIWFFNDQEVTTKDLVGEDVDVYSMWFSYAQKEWNNFDKNKGHYFSVPDQLRNLVLDRSFRSEGNTPTYLSYFLTFLPIFLIGMLLYFIFSRQVKGVGSSVMGFGKSPAKLLDKKGQVVTFKDVAGVDEAKEELEEVVDFLKEPARFTKLGARIPKGVLLIGSPGTGKTLTAKAVAGEAGVPFFAMSGSDFVEMFVGVGASRVRDLFTQAKKNAPCILFIDEIDAVGRHRGSGLGGGHDEREQTLNQLLVEIDGMSSTEGIIIIAATNRPDVLDNALLRPGRFDRSVIVDLPDVRGRLAILQVHIKGVKLSKQVDLQEVANRTTGLSGADLRNIVNEAALYAAKKRRLHVIQEDFRYAQEKVQLGKERKSLVRDKEDKKITSWHESGHALIGLYLSTGDKVSKVTCIARGRSLGSTHFEEKTNRISYRKTELLDKLTILMGGRVGEEILNNDPSNGAKMDIEQATIIARSMVKEWGMSEKLGMVNLSEDSKKNIMATQKGREYSEATAGLVDQEVRNLLHQAYMKAWLILTKNLDLLKVMSNALFEFETLEVEDLRKIMSGKWNSEEKRASMALKDEQDSTPPPIPNDVIKSHKSMSKKLKFSLI